MFLRGTNNYFIPGYTGFCPAYRDCVGKSYGVATHNIIQENPFIGERLSPVFSDICDVTKPKSETFDKYGPPKLYGHQRMAQSARQQHQVRITPSNGCASRDLTQPICRCKSSKESPGNVSLCGVDRLEHAENHNCLFDESQTCLHKPDAKPILQAPGKCYCNCSGDYQANMESYLEHAKPFTVAKRLDPCWDCCCDDVPKTWHKNALYGKTMSLVPKSTHHPTWPDESKEEFLRGPEPITELHRTSSLPAEQTLRKFGWKAYDKASLNAPEYSSHVPGYRFDCGYSCNEGPAHLVDKFYSRQRSILGVIPR